MSFRTVKHRTDFMFQYERRLLAVLDRLCIKYYSPWRPPDYPIRKGYGSGFITYLPDYNLGIVFNGKYRTGGLGTYKRKLLEARDAWYKERGITMLYFDWRTDQATMELMIRRRIK